MEARATPILTLLLGALLGLAAGYFVAEGRSAPAPDAVEVRPNETTSSAARAVESSPEIPSGTRAPAAAASGESSKTAADAPPAAADDLIGPGLRAYARREIREGWADVRRDTIPELRLASGEDEFEKRVLAMPREIGKRLGAEQTRADRLEADARLGGAFTLLEGLASGEPAPVEGLVSDAGAFERLFARGTEESVVRGELAKEGLARLNRSGQTIEFGVGCFAVDIGFEDRDNAPSDVTIAGAGMDRTLLVLSREIYAGGALRRFSIRDCTVFTNDHYLMDKRGGPATLLLERLRVVGFDMGAGSSCALGFGGDSGLVLLARDCRFEGGYGRSPQHGQLIRIGTPAFVARFERCRVDRTALGLRSIPTGASALFDGCTLSDLTDAFARFGTPEQRARCEQELRSLPGMLLAGSTISFFDNAAHGLEPTDWTVPGRDITALFPGARELLGK